MLFFVAAVKSFIVGTAVLIAAAGTLAMLDSFWR